MLDPDVVVRTDIAGAPAEIRGARNWAQNAIAFSRMAQSVQPALVNGSAGLVLAPRGRLSRALSFTIERGKIVQVDIIADPRAPEPDQYRGPQRLTANPYASIGEE